MEQTPLPPLVSDERKPLSYYMRNGLWYFTQPPDPLTGQVIPYTTVESWLSRVEEMEAERQRTREVVQALVDGIETMRQGAFADAFIFANDAELDAHAKKLLALVQSTLNIEPSKP